MQRGTKSELQMLREFWWLRAPNMCCFFCHEALDYNRGEMTFGHRRHPPVEAKFTVHHENHNRENNLFDNLKVCHTQCHRRYHANLRRTHEPDDVVDSGEIS